MTEAEWQSCEDHRAMVEFLGGRTSTRKLRLYLCACSRVNWPSLEDERSQKAVEVGERFADGRATRRELRAAYRGARAATNGGLSWWVRFQYGPFEVAPWLATALDCAAVDDDLAEMARCAWARYSDRHEPVGSALVRDIFANPFRPRPAIEPAWLVWNDGTILRMATAIYEERQLPSGHLDTAHLAVLADALEESGCDNEEMVSHLRQQGASHYRGCWVIDLLLDKE